MSVLNVLSSVQNEDHTVSYLVPCLTPKLLAKLGYVFLTQNLALLLSHLQHLNLALAKLVAPLCYNVMHFIWKLPI